ncbi:GH39 family glycosyl hydrolase [Salinibacterium soli]|uniref:Glycosyl hydrolases family 39 N-terminal catalytic domain-containing protein n=1 Tax=Antiquaquibacter soli TaxID=3064523 RepID=A0ABT9BQM4_9MICO|nr:hypothetical protein [Protaetiibacter sp. WY-16]MDO7882713.1 hypothetical protein [Protaetiibacter sp. WY-16]
MKLKRAGMVAGALLLTGTLALTPIASQALPGPTFTVDLRTSGKTYENTFSNLLAWSNDHWWSTGASSISSSYYSTYYPELEEVQLLFITGGCYTGYTNPITCGPARDPFVDPTDTSTMTDYDFDSIMTGLDNIVRSGLTPYLKIGSQPIKYSSSPKIGVFGTNTAPPANYTTYYNYLRALVSRAVTEFGATEVRSWRWGVLTEYDNRDQFEHPDGTAASTKVAYFKLYDWSAKALEDELGAGNVKIGAHAQGNIGGFWDYRELLDHVTTGTNYATGGTGSPMDYMSISFYDNSPTSLTNFANTLATLRAKIDAVGLNGLEIGIDEGSMFAPDGDPNGDLSTSFQSALHAWRYQLATDYDLSWWGRWGLSTDGVYSYSEPVIVNPTVTNLGKLVKRMSGSQQLAVSYAGTPSDNTNQVGSYSGYDASTDTLYVMVFNRNNSPTSTSSETVEVNLTNIANSSPVATKFLIDDTHSNFFPTWAANRAAQGYGASDYRVGASLYNWLLPDVLTTPAAASYWNSQKSTYASLSALNELSASSNVTFTSTTAKITVTMPPQGVALFKVTGVTPIP